MITVELGGVQVTGGGGGDDSSEGGSDGRGVVTAAELCFGEGEEQNGDGCQNDQVEGRKAKQ